MWLTRPRLGVNCGRAGVRSGLREVSDPLAMIAWPSSVAYRFGIAPQCSVTSFEFFTDPVLTSSDSSRYFDIGCSPAYPADPASNTSRILSPAKTAWRVAPNVDPVFVSGQGQVVFWNVTDQSFRAAGGCGGATARAMQQGTVSSTKAMTLPRKCICGPRGG